MRNLDRRRLSESSLLNASADTEAAGADTARRFSRDVGDVVVHAPLDRAGPLVARALTAAALVAGSLVLTVGAAEAGPYRSGCSSFVHTTSPWTGGFSAVCNGSPTSVQYRVVGLCKNRFSNKGRTVYGPWQKEGVSFAGCSRYEVPVPNGFYQTR